MSKRVSFSCHLLGYLIVACVLVLPFLTFAQYNWITLETDPTWWANNGTHIYSTRTGSVVIGTNNPGSGNIVHVAGEMGATDYCDSTGTECFKTTESVWSLTGNNIYNKNTANVGLGVSTPSQKLSVDGMILADNYLYSSDRRFKTNIRPLGGLDIISQLRGVSFNWREDNKADVGLIAQEVEQVLPQLVATDSLGYKSVDYASLVALLVATLNEQQAELRELEQELDKLER